jgi:hypothetical protein
VKGTKSIVLPNCLRKINKFVVILQVLELPEYEFLHLRYEFLHLDCINLQDMLIMLV